MEANKMHYFSTLFW